VAERLQQEVGEELNSNPDLCEALHHSEYDLDQLVLFIFRGQQLRNALKLFRSFLIFCLLTGTPLLAQQKAAAVSLNEEPMSSFEAVNASIDTILQQYEELTGNILIKDSNLAANALPISLSVPEPVPRSELVRTIESALLLNNYALIPGPEPNTVKVINMNAGKNPRSEGLPLYASPAWPSRR
jgi:type II secretory pathway component GspD/PulD (secretin)